mmetsp:Transcript_106101/g.300189  ORF Transcript_106101/g.300189 Transcript_106101/m.300189 type:complete len:314 (-) Transcript_106101:381-1322(-)
MLWARARPPSSAPESSRPSTSTKVFLTKARSPRLPPASEPSAPPIQCHSAAPFGSQADHRLSGSRGPWALQSTCSSTLLSIAASTGGPAVLQSKLRKESPSPAGTPSSLFTLWPEESAASSSARSPAGHDSSPRSGGCVLALSCAAANSSDSDTPSVLGIALESCSVTAPSRSRSPATALPPRLFLAFLFALRPCGLGDASMAAATSSSHTSAAASVSLSVSAVAGVSPPAAAAAASTAVRAMPPASLWAWRMANPTSLRIWPMKSVHELAVGSSVEGQSRRCRGGRFLRKASPRRCSMCSKRSSLSANSRLA